MQRKKKKGKSLYEKLLDKYGKNEADKRYANWKIAIKVGTKRAMGNLSLNKKKKLAYWKNKKHSEETIKKMKDSHSGENNHMYGKSLYDYWLEKYGLEETEKRYAKFRKNVSSGNKKRYENKDEREKTRLATLKSVEKKYGQIRPFYNDSGCEIIRWLNMYYDFNFKHAENGGEYFIKDLHYWVDGYDENKNIVVEIYERTHYNRNGELKEKEINRENRIINYLNCKFMRVNMFDSKNIKIETI